MPRGPLPSIDPLECPKWLSQGPGQCDWYVQRLEKLKMEGRDDVDFDTVLEMLRAEETAREKAAEAEETEVGRQPSDEAQR